MNKNLLLMLFVFETSPLCSQPASQLKLWCKLPAETLIEAVPVNNGR